MKKTARKLVLWLLTVLAKKRMKKFRGKIVVVIGSIGKTSTKDSIFTVLNRQFKVKRSPKSMNSEFGLLLTILDIESGYSSAGKWFLLLLKAFVYSFMKEHSEILLLELGTDKPGDMDFLKKIISPDIVVWTNCTATHMDEGQFASVREIFEEDKKIFDAMPRSGVAILNCDNALIKDFYDHYEGNKVSFGAEADFDFYTNKVISDLEGVQFEMISQKGQKMEISSPLIGYFQYSVLMPAAIVGLRFGILQEIIQDALEDFQLPPGRMTPIEGKGDILLLDSTYNSSPAAVIAALEVLDEVGNQKRKVAVLGNMNELGEESETLHKMVGKYIPQKVDLLITVGKQAGFIADMAIERGMDVDMVFKVTYAKEAVEKYSELQMEGDLVLVKGSQNRVRLERFVKEFMLYPEMAEELLVRQEKHWR